jgi:hypothetical protein
MDYIEIITAQSPDYRQESQTSTVQPQNTILPDSKSLSVPDYLIGLAFLLVLVAIISELFQLVKYRTKSQRLSNIELLEKIWKMDAAKIRE